MYKYSQYAQYMYNNHNMHDICTNIHNMHNICRIFTIHLHLLWCLNTILNLFAVRDVGKLLFKDGMQCTGFMSVPPVNNISLSTTINIAPKCSLQISDAACPKMTSLSTSIPSVLLWTDVYVSAGAFAPPLLVIS